MVEEGPRAVGSIAHCDPAAQQCGHTVTTNQEHEIIMYEKAGIRIWA